MPVVFSLGVPFGGRHSGKSIFIFNPVKMAYVFVIATGKTPAIARQAT